jgi:N-acyl homoserine lactone hydrolase
VGSTRTTHYRFNLEHRCVPTMNFDIGQSLSSMDRIDAIVRDEKVQLWLNHDTVQSAIIPHAPAYFD